MSKQKVDLAAYHLGLLYRQAAHQLQQALVHTGVSIRHSCPRLVEYEPYQLTSTEGGPDLHTMRVQVQLSNELVVSSLNCDSTVYDSPQDNHWFRFMHDMGHLLYNCEFDFPGEVKLHGLLWSWIETTPMYWALDEECRRWVLAVYMADTYGQTDYFEQVGEFPQDQRAFVHAKAQEYYDAQA